MNTNIHIIARRTQLVESAITPSEAEVLVLAAEGKRNSDIAQIRGVSVWTVKRQMYSAMEKLDARNRTEAAVLWDQRRRAA